MLGSPMCFFSEVFQREDDLENACLVGQVQGESWEKEKYQVLSGTQPSKTKKVLLPCREDTECSSITFLDVLSLQVSLSGNLSRGMGSSAVRVNSERWKQRDL